MRKAAALPNLLDLDALRADIAERIVVNATHARSAATNSLAKVLWKHARDATTCQATLRLGFIELLLKQPRQETL